MIQNYKIKLRVLSLLLACFLLYTGIFPVYATDSVKDLEATTSDLENEMSDLNQELETLTKEATSITKQIQKMRTRIEETQEALAIAKGKEDAQYEAMKLRIKHIYESGDTSALELLFASSSMADFLSRAEYVAMVNQYDRDELAKMQKTRETIAEQEAQLATEKAALEDLQADLKYKESNISSKIDSTSSELADYKKQLIKAKDEARKAEQELAQQVKPVKPTTSTGSNNREDLNVDYTANASDIELFAGIIECEAGSTHYEGMLAVASVIMNRVNHHSYPNTLQGVIFQSGQFPPATNGKLDRILARGVKQSCVDVANDALAGKNNVGSCLSFRSASSGRPGTIIGSNVFF